MMYVCLSLERYFTKDSENKGGHLIKVVTGTLTSIAEIL
jgi:hypothetical protein